MLYHYTQLKNFSKIFTNDQTVFRMYDSRWMNDPSESQILQQYIIQYQKDISSELETRHRGIFQDAISVSSEFEPTKILPTLIYVLAFSTIRDSNIFWGSKYSGLNGFSLAIDESKIINEKTRQIGFNKMKDVYYFQSIEGKPNTHDIKHVAKELIEVMDNLKRDDTKINDKDLPYVVWEIINSDLSIFHKHPSWSHEREKRFVIMKKSKSNFLGVNEDIGIHYLPSGAYQGGVNVYCEHAKVDFENNVFPRPYIEIELDANIIDHITLGPKLSIMDIEAAKNYLYKTSHGVNIDISLSGAQIR